MIAVTDIGNTSIKLALVEHGVVRRQVRVASGASSADLARACRRLVRRVRTIDAAVVSSVRPARTAAVMRALRDATGLAPVLFTHRTPMPLTVAVPVPARVGADRLAGACAAVAGRHRNAIIVNAGTAITVDLVLGRRFLGGVIMPGPGTTLRALHAFTAQLPEVDFTRGAMPPAGIGDTRSAMRWGAALSASGGAQAAVAMLEWRARRPVRVLVTGGHARRLLPFLPPEWLYVPDLTLVGLAAAVARG